MKTTKCPESLCPALRYLHWRGVSHLLGGRCPSLIAPTDSCAKPAWLSAPSVFSLVQGVFAGRFQPLLPTGSSRRYLCESFLRCLIPYPAVPQSAFTCFFFCGIGLPPRRKRVGFRSFSQTRLSARQDFGAADISLCSGLQVCLSPRSFLPLQYCRRAAETFTSGQNALRYLHTHRIC